MSKYEIDRALAHTALRLRGRTITDFGQLFTRVIERTRVDRVALAGPQKVIKLIEEVGELAESILQKERSIHKDKVGTPIEEAADIILMLVDILSDQYSEEDSDRLVAALEFELMRKNLKWEKYQVIGDQR